MLNKPVLCLSDHGKLDSLMTEIGLTEYCLSLANLNFNDVIDRVTKLEKNAKALRLYIKQKTEDYRTNNHYAKARSSAYHFASQSFILSFPTIQSHARKSTTFSGSRRGSGHGAVLYSQSTIVYH